MKARQHLQRLAFLTSVLLAPGVGLFSIVSILIVDGSGGGLIGSSPAQAEGVRRRTCSRHRYECKALRATKHSAL